MYKIAQSVSPLIGARADGTHSAINGRCTRASTDLSVGDGVGRGRRLVLSGFGGGSGLGFLEERFLVLLVFLV